MFSQCKFIQALEPLIIVVVCGFVILIGYFLNINCFLAYHSVSDLAEIIVQMARRGPFRGP